MKFEYFKETVSVFIEHFPVTLKKTSIWLIISYIVPLINIAIICGIRQSFDFDLQIVSILLVTNSCFITSLVFLINKKREFTGIANVVLLIMSIVLFAFSVAQMELGTVIFSNYLYKFGALILLILSIFIGFVSKYDEVEAASASRAKKGKNTTETQVGDKKVTL